MNEANNSNQPVTFESTIESIGGTETTYNSNADENKVKNQSKSSSPNLEQEDNSQPNSKPTKNIDWHKLAHKLREHNRKLLKQVFQLEQEVADANNRIEEHRVRSQSTDLLIAQQAEEINHNQEEIAHLRQELETSQQEAHSQQVLINSLSKQLEASNEQFAQLERECALLQEKYNQQTHELVVKNQQEQELSARLNRQQRYTLQYKAALDQYLDVASSGLLSETKSESELLLTHPQPIQAWSQEQTTTETSTIKASNLGSHQENSTSESKLKPSNTNTKEANWPSPLINTVDSDKKPKSLAAVELPTFHHSN